MYQHSDVNPIIRMFFFPSLIKISVQHQRGTNKWLTLFLIWLPKTRRHSAVTEEELKLTFGVFAFHRKNGLGRAVVNL